jgi:prepilin-type N-terminal cleavage/methylation domain-containing protein
MIGRRPSSQRMRPGLTLVELLVAIAVLGLFEALLLTAQAPAPAPPPPTPLSTAEPFPAPVTRAPSGGELSLQATLDLLGFTVNVPREYEGRRLANWRPGRVSTRSDALPSGWFEADGPVQFLEVSRQSALSNVTAFSAETTGGRKIELFPRIESTPDDGLPHRPGPWPEGNGAGSSDMAARRVRREIHGTVRFSLSFPPNPFNPGTLFSTAQGNPDGLSHMLALRARRGGTWVDEGGNTGHYEGAAEDGTYLLCWEDAVNGDNDFQDLVVYAEGIRPAQR